ncbi:MAG: hypothetical protein ACREL7_08590 [Longimicrobiales bacterium]
MHRVIYLLLTGRHPYGVQHSRAELERVALEVEPRVPNATVAHDEEAPAISAVRRTTLAQLARQLRFDLDTMALKAMRKEPSQRYTSALVLADDIERYLSGLPYTRGRQQRATAPASPSVANRALVGAAAAVFLVLAGATTMSLPILDFRSR